MIQSNNISFKPDRYYELMKKYPAPLNESERLEQSDYSNKLFKYLFWENKKEFLILAKNFVNFELDSEEFNYQFLKCWRSNQKLMVEISLEKLKNIKVDETLKTEEFDNFWKLVDQISYISNLYDLVQDESGEIICLGESDKIDQQFREKIIKAYEDYQLISSAIDTQIISDTYLIKSSTSSQDLLDNDVQELKFVMEVFTIATLLVFCILRPEIFDFLLDYLY